MTISGNDFNLLQKNYFLKSGFSTSIQFALKSLDTAFNNFFKRKGKIGYPQFKKKSSSDSITITPNNWKFIHVVTNHRLPDLGSNSKSQENINKSHIDNCGKTPSIYDYLLYFSGCDKPLKIKLDGRDFNPSTISKINLSYNASGQYFITFLADEDLKNIKSRNILKNNENYLKVSDPDTGEYSPIHTAIDLGIKNTLNIRSIQKNSGLNNNDNYLEKKLKGLNRHNKKLRRYQQNLSRKKKGSHNYNKQRIKVAKLHQKMVNIRTDFYHQESTRIVLESDKIMVETLHIKGMVKNKRNAKNISQQGWGQFISMLKYKSQWYGKTLIEADRFFPSSKICSHCKQYNTNVKREDKWVCQYCETKHQRDENATKNLLEYEAYIKIGKRYIHKKDLNNSSKSQAELKNINKEIKLSESSGEVKTVEKCKTQIIQNNNFSNFNEAVSVNLD
jgi:putative transposase